MSGAIFTGILIMAASGLKISLVAWMKIPAPAPRHLCVLTLADGRRFARQFDGLQALPKRADFQAAFAGVAEPGPAWRLVPAGAQP